MERFNIGKFQISRVNQKTALEYIKKSINNGKSGYICVSNARVAKQSNYDDEFCKIQNSSLLTVPDGKPLVWIAHNKGYRDVGQVAGNELFHGLLEMSGKNGFTHYFYGGTPDTIEKMKYRLGKDYPEVKLLGAEAPPFQPIEKYDIESIAQEINRLKPTFFWIGIGAPKQERLMSLLQPKLQSTICIGVGLVFEYFAGNVKRAPEWARKMGLEGVVNCFQQPIKRGKRMADSLPWVIYQIIKSYTSK